MNLFALELDAEQWERLREARQMSLDAGHCYRPEARRGPINLNLRKVTPAIIEAAKAAFASGESAWSVSRKFFVGHETALAINQGRYDGDGLLPLELECGEQYCEPHNCPHGHYIKIEPCRECKTIAAIDAIKELERQQRAERFAERGAK